MDLVEWKVYNTINSVPIDFWETNISKNDLLKHRELFVILENIYNERKFLYVLITKCNEIIGFSCFTIFKEDLLSDLKLSFLLKIRKIFPNFMKSNVMMMGSLETAGEHWWYNEKYFTPDSFFNQLYQFILSLKIPFNILIFRDFIEKSDQSILTQDQVNILGKIGFSRVVSWPFAQIEIKENVNTIDQYLNQLSVNGRKLLKKGLKEYLNNGFSFSEVYNYKDYIDSIYALYLETSNNASEFKRDPLPKKFFTNFLSNKRIISSVQMIKNKEDKIIAFIFSLENDSTIYPYLLGRNYEIERETYLIYQIYYLMIQSAINKGFKRIELGITNYFVKQRCGAVLLQMDLFIRIKNPLINLLLKPVLPKLVK